MESMNTGCRSVFLGFYLPVALAVASRTSGESTADWRQFRGPTGQGAASEAGLPSSWGAKENVLWKTALPGPGASTPIIAGDRIYLTCFSGYGTSGRAKGSMEELRLHLVCAGVKDGKILWTSDVQPKLPEEETIREGHGYASSTPTADSQRIYCFFGKSGVIAFHLDGTRSWRADVGEKTSGWGSAASPVPHGELLIVNASVESESLVALDKATGKEVWRAGGIKESWNTPIIASLGGGKEELVLAIQGKVLGFDPGSGEQLWSCATDIGWYMVPSLLSRDGIVYCIGGRNTGGSLAVRAGGRGDVTRSHRLWTLKKGSNVTSPVLSEGHLYWIHENLGIAYCVEARTGALVYEERLDGADQVYASALLAGGKIYYLTRSGRAFVLKAGPKLERLAVNELEERGRFNASPAVAGGRLFLRSDKYLYSIGTAANEEPSKEETVFQEKFSGKLAAGWSWVREDKKAWRLTEKGLEVQTQPGNMWGKTNDAKNLLQRDAPDASKGAVIAEVTVKNEPTEQYEQAGMTWYYDDSNMVKLVKERVDGKVHVVMGREENDATRTIALLPREGSSFQLRLRVEGRKITGFYRIDEKGEWQEVGSCDLPGAKAPAKVCLQTYNGPAKAEHWVVFSGFSIRKGKG